MGCPRLLIETLPLPVPLERPVPVPLERPVMFDLLVPVLVPVPVLEAEAEAEAVEGPSMSTRLSPNSSYSSPSSSGDSPPIPLIPLIPPSPPLETVSSLILLNPSSCVSSNFPTADPDPEAEGLGGNGIRVFSSSFTPWTPWTGEPETPAPEEDS